MSAHDNLSKQLFHGSTYSYKPGDVIVPREDPYAFATNDPENAAEYAETGHIQTHHYGGQTALWNPVYSVTPVSSREMAHTTKKAQGSEYEAPGHYMSKKGFTVQGLHELVENPYLK